jgi:hypothetical protein
MGSYPLDVLLRKWSLGELTVEQAIGQLIQVLLELVKRVEELEDRLR